MICRDNEAWVKEQFSDCQLGDARRTKRLNIVAQNMLDAPEKSLPQQNPNWSDLKAAYRLLDQSEVTFSAVCEPHWQQTRQTRPGRYLLISDTTDLDHSSHQATTGLGMLGDGNGRGMQMHHCLVYDTDQQLIAGMAGGRLHHRSRVPENETRMERLQRVRESELWGDLVTDIGSPPVGSRWIHVFDRGGDNFEAMCRVQQSGCDWIIRAAKLNRTVLDEQDQRRCLSDVTQDARVLGSYDLCLRSRPGIAARTAHLQVLVTPVIFPHPEHRSPWLRQCPLKQLTMNVVIVQEVNPPPGVTPIRWVLLTSLPVETFADAWQVIEDYECRWLIEEYHKVLKTGCDIEGASLRTAERLEPLVGLTAVVGIRLFQMKLLGRSQPQAKAQSHVPSSWLKCLALLRPKLKITGLTVYEFFRELAKLGGFLGRKHDGEPGWQTIWHGYQKLQSILAGLRLAGKV